MFKVTGSTELQKIRVSVSDNKVGSVVNGKTQYRSVTLEFLVSAALPFITITSADLLKAAADFDVTKISSVTFVADETTLPQPAAGGKNTVTVTGSGLGCIPQENGTATGTLTDLSALSPIAGALVGQGSVVSNVKALSSTQLSYQYGPITAGSGDYGGAILVLGQDTDNSKDGVLESF